MSNLLKEEIFNIKTGKGKSKIPAILFKAQIDAKITHLINPNKTLALHEAMGKFYDEIDGLLDTFVETYMGLYSLTIITEGSSVILKPADYFQNLYNTINEERKNIVESFLQNQIDSIQELVSHTLYRLKYIQD